MVKTQAFYRPTNGDISIFTETEQVNSCPNYIFHFRYPLPCPRWKPFRVISLPTSAGHQMACYFPSSSEEYHKGSVLPPYRDTDCLYTLPILRCSSSYLSCMLFYQKSLYFVLSNTLTSVEYFLNYFFYSKDTTRYTFLKSQDKAYSNLPFLLSSSSILMAYICVSSRVLNTTWLCGKLTKYLFIISATVLIWIARLSSHPFLQCEYMIERNVSHIFIRYFTQLCLILIAIFLCYAATSAVFWSHHSSEVWQNLYVFSWLKFAIKIQAIWAVHIDLWIYLHVENVTFSV